MSYAITHTVMLGGRKIPLMVRNNRRAKRISLRLNQSHRLFTLTLPHRVSMKRGMDFLHDKRDWLLQTWRSLPTRIPFEDGQVIPFLGRELTICHRPRLRGVVTIDGDRLLVSGEAEHLSRRLHDWLKAEARRHFAALARRKAEELGCRIGRVSVRDTHSRWGSCSAKGHLSFCWRLIFAPRKVADYIVAHEVAHLREMNHGPRFWRLVEALCPDYEDHIAWLKRHGGNLHHIG